MSSLVQRVIEGGALSRRDAAAALHELTDCTTTPEAIAGFLHALRARGETIEELIGFVIGARELALPLGELPAALPAVLMDVCGTGGDGGGTFNISTTVSFVVAGAGIGVAKHGNRSVSSRSGSADVLESLGVRTELEPARVLSSIVRSRFGFFFAPKFHPAFRAVSTVRKTMAVRTVFNLLGPLLNPARVRRQVIGVYDENALDRVGEALRATGTEEAMIFRAEDGLDELSLASATRVVHLKDGELRRFVVKPEDVAMTRAPLSALAGGDALENAAILVRILDGERGPRRDIVLLNAAAALVVAGQASTLVEGAALAAEVIDSGAAARALSLAMESRP